MTDKNKMSKKAQREMNKAQRTVVQFNTGTRVHKSAKHPDRAARKRAEQKEGAYNA